MVLRGLGQITMLKALLFATVWLGLLCLIGYGTIKYVQYKDDLAIQTMKNSAENDMKELELSNEEYWKK